MPQKRYIPPNSFDYVFEEDPTEEPENFEGTDDQSRETEYRTDVYNAKKYFIEKASEKETREAAAELETLKIKLYNIFTDPEFCGQQQIASKYIGLEYECDTLFEERDLLVQLRQLITIFNVMLKLVKIDRKSVEKFAHLQPGMYAELHKIRNELAPFSIYSWIYSQNILEKIIEDDVAIRQDHIKWNKYINSSPEQDKEVIRRLPFDVFFDSNKS